jgi:hypothetical protein
VNGTPWPVEIVGVDSARGRAFQLLERDHVRSEKLGPLCERIAYGFCQEYDRFLRAIQAKNPHKEVQAIACLSLARFLSNRLERIELCKQQPELAKEFADLFGAAYLAELRQQERQQMQKQIDAVFERAATEYADVKLSDGESVGTRAKKELFAIHHLSVGSQALEIEGEDQDGKKFKLSDYRGKVVLLDFWSFA